jgi:hypothetical protein
MAKRHLIAEWLKRQAMTIESTPPLTASKTLESLLRFSDDSIRSK